MNGFRLFSNFQQGEVNFKIFVDVGAFPERMHLVLSYSGDDYFPGDSTKFGVGHKHFYMDRAEWMERRNYSDVDSAVSDFRKTIKEFDTGIPWKDFENPLAKYLVMQANEWLKNIQKEQ
jgi:hypothetical protein